MGRQPRILDDQAIINIVVEACESKKAKDIKVLDIASKASIASFFVICSSEATPQFRAIAEEIEDQARAHNIKGIRIEGDPKSGWVVVDLHSVLVHIMSPRERSFYKLEELWGESGIIYHE